MNFHKLPLWLVWVVSYLLLLALSTLLVGYVSFINGQSAVRDLANQLLNRTTLLIDQQLDSYLSIPKSLVQSNAQALEIGTLDWQDFKGLGQHFWNQAKTYNLSYINYGLKTGEYAGAGYLDSNGTMAIGETSAATNDQYYDFFVDDQGTIIESEPDPEYDHFSEAWYIDAINKNKLTWSEIYFWEGTYSTMSVGIGQPIYRGHTQPIGAIGIDLSLASIRDLLQESRTSPTMRIFVIERDGKVVSTSSKDLLFSQINKRAQRVNITNSDDPLIQTTARYLISQFGTFQTLDTNHSLEFEFNQEMQFVRVMPWHDDIGLDWLVVIVVPESDFMSQINANTRQSIWLSMAALTLAIIVGIITARWITRPALALKHAAEEIASGHLDQRVATSRLQELDTVGQSFNRMADQLQESFGKLDYAASHDSLTGLFNQRVFREKLNLVIKKTRGPTPTTGADIAEDRAIHPHFAVLFVDLDYFKLVNDSLGHLEGDRVLVEVAHRLQESLRNTDLLARFGGDEFVILLDPIHELSEATQIAKQILQQVSKPIVLDEKAAFIGASIGIAYSEQQTASADEVLRNADIALYRAKANGRAAYEIFDNTMHVEVVERLQLGNELRKGLDQGELSIDYQPMVDTNTLAVIGLEALARWNHPTLGAISPAKFIPIAEETGLIIPLGLWILRTTCQQMRAWQLQFPQIANMTVSVNLSPRQFLEPNLVQQLQLILKETDLAPRALKLEITESLLIGNRPSMRERLQQLKDLGIQLSLDDFGTGYSSLSYLHQFPLDTLKIDRSFIQQLTTDKQSLAIVETITALAHTLGLNVVAEGVETQAEFECLRSVVKCEQIQGFLISPAMPVQELTAWISQRNDI